MADTTITPASPLSWPASLAVPTPGDPIKAATPAGAVRPGYQALLNGVASAQARQYNRPSQIRVEGESNTSLVIWPVAAFTVLDAGVWKTYTDVDTASQGTGGGVTTVDPDALTGGLDPNSRYWVFLKKPTGADPFDVEIVKQGAAATFPDRNFAYLAADQSAALLTTFYVDHAGNMLPYRQLDGEFMYKTRTAVGGGIRGNLILDAGNATGSTSVNWGDSVSTLGPAWFSYEARAARAGAAFIGAILLNATDFSQTLSGDGVVQLFDYKSGTIFGNGSTLYYQVDNAATTMSIWVTGFRIW